MTPNSTSARLSMLARTGRRMDRSEIFMSESGSQVSTLRFLPGFCWPKWWIDLLIVDRALENRPRSTTTENVPSRFNLRRSGAAPGALDSRTPIPYAMAHKLSSRQQAQLAFLERLPPKFQRMHGIIEQMGGLKVDETILRGFGRLLDEIKGNAQALSLNGIAESAGLMGTMLRRGGGLQFRVRGLREMLGSLKTNYEGALRAATTPEDPETAQPES